MIEVSIKETSLSLDDCMQKVASSKCGGTTVFVGTARDETNGKKVLRLEFEAYHKMAEKELTKIAEMAKKRWAIESLIIHHRDGLVKAGETVVIVVVAARRRDSAFKACRYAIDTLKETVPIWKKEVFEDGSSWVEPHP